MSHFHLTPPAPEHEAAYLDFVHDWAEHNEDITPYFVRFYQDTYAAFLEYSKSLESWETCAPWVPCTNYFLFDGEKLVGALNLRHTLNDQLLATGGHIGYGVRPTSRGQGYASTMLKLGLEKARELGITKALLTCNKDNIASVKVILANGGVLENEVDDDGTPLQRYWITLS